MYAQLLIDLFKFLTPYLRNAELAKPTQLLYKVIRKCVGELVGLLNATKLADYL